MAELEVSNLMDLASLQLETAKLLDDIKDLSKKKKVNSPFKGK